MKRTLLSKFMLLLCLFIVGGGNFLWAADVVYSTCLFGSSYNSGSVGDYTTTWTATNGGFTWSIVNGSNNNNGWNYIKFGRKENASVGTITTSAAYEVAVTKVEVTIDALTVSKINSVKLYTSPDNSTWEETGTFDKSTGAKAVSLVSPDKNLYYKIEFDCASGSSNGLITVSKVDFYQHSDVASVATPTLSPNGSSTYNTAQSVTISCETEGATIRYTTNGDDITNETSGNAYTGAITVNTSGTTIKAKAFKDGMLASAQASATYTLKPDKPYMSAFGKVVTMATATDGAAIRYTTNGSTPNGESTLYEGPIELGANCSIKAKAFAFGNSSDATNYTYTYSSSVPKNINSNRFVKVTDVSSLEDGDAILIVNETNNVAISTTQTQYNRSKANVSISTGIITNPSSDVQKIIIRKDGDYYYFYTGALGYLYAASSSSNLMKTETDPDANNNAKATISITDGDATIQFQGTNTNSWLKYNRSNDLFSCYSTSDATQKIVQIYKEVAANTNVSISSAKYATFCDNYARNFSTSDITVYKAKAKGTYVTLTEIADGIVPANEGVVLYSNVALNDVAIPAALTDGSGDFSDNEMIGINEATNVVKNPGDGKTNYILSNETEGVGFYLAAEDGAILGAHRAYLSTTTTLGAREFLGFDTETNGIKTIKSSGIEANGYYNLNGQRVVQPTKGLYIVNGKKIVMK